MSSGGPVLTLCDAPREPQRGAWGPDGAILFSIGRVYRVPDTGGVPQPVTDLDVSQGETHHTVMGFLSDGRRFIFGDRPHRGTFFVSLMDSARDRRSLAIGGLDDEIRDVSTTRGYLLYSKRGTIVAQPFDEARVSVEGPTHHAG